MNYQNGSLSGYVNDSLSNPIEGALVSIKCGGLHMQNTSDSNGFYYIDDVPIVDCYWNVSASKKGYETAWVNMSIDINSTYDFIIKSSNNIIYVDDNNTKGPWNGSIDFPFQYIQMGINAANKTDIVLIYPGIYDENIKISKQIQLIGIDKEKTIISAKNSSEYLIIDSVNFTLINNITFSCIYNERLDIIKMINCTNCVISNIIITSKKIQRSAIIVNGSNNIIEHVTINGRFIFSGIELFYTDYNSIKNNSIESSGGGIHIFRSHNNIILSNTLTNNSNGIYIEEGNQNYITKNILNRNNRGLFSSYSTKNMIEKNDFIDNDEHAKFTKLLKKGFLLPNNWNNNYWGDYKGFLIKPIPGVLYIPNRYLIGFFLPWFEFDISPSNEPLNQ
jgi:parallel beta-helix repeat protein